MVMILMNGKRISYKRRTIKHNNDIILAIIIRRWLLLKQQIHQEVRDPNVALLYFATHVAFNTPDGAVPLGRYP